MASLKPNTNTTLAKINEALVNNQESSFREHLGASIIGRDCDRQLFYSFRWVKEIKHAGRILRLFERGHLEEERFLKWLRMIGVEALSIDPDTGEQFRFNAVGGHFGGSCDGLGMYIPEAPKTPHILEFKTSGEKAFKDLKAKGVEESKPEHYAQVQVYMKLKGFTRTLYMAINKNTDELYVERIRYNASFAELMIEKAERIIKSEQPPERMPGAHKDFYKCNWCDFKSICYGNELPEVNCRTCASATCDTENGGWLCELHDSKIPVDVQKTGCDQHLYYPAYLEHFSEPVGGCMDYENRFIKYELKKEPNVFFRNGPVKPNLSSKCLKNLPQELIGNDFIEGVRSAFPDSQVIEVPNTWYLYHPESNSAFTVSTEYDLQESLSSGECVEITEQEYQNIVSNKNNRNKDIISEQEPANDDQFKLEMGIPF